MASASISASVSGSPRSATCQLKANSASPLSTPSTSWASRLAGSAVEGGGRLEVATQAARPEHVDAARAEGLDAVLEQADQVVGRRA